MFNNPGGKIKMIAKTVFWIGCIAALIEAIVFAYGSSKLKWIIYGMGVKTENAMDIALLLAFILIVALGILASWLSTIVLFGFGELVENSGYNQTTVITNSHPPVVSAPQVQPESKQEQKPVSIIPEGMIKCPICGKIIPLDSVYCPQCGVKLKE
jgi:hypothetical protein